MVSPSDGQVLHSRVSPAARHEICGADESYAGIKETQTTKDTKLHEGRLNVEAFVKLRLLCGLGFSAFGNS
jgi:hypothetical protein